MPAEKRERPAIKGEDAKKFLKNEKEVDERLKNYVDKKTTKNNKKQ